MKTIKFLADSINFMKANGTPANITVGTFKIESRGSLHFWAGQTGTFETCSLSFEIEFRPDHIQKLIDMGVKIDFNTIKSSMSAGSPYFKTGRDAIKQGRYYSRTGGVAENWLIASAKCGLDTLLKLDAFCRDNHLHHISIHNDTCTGWNKAKYPYIEPKKSLFYKNVRKNLAAKSKKYADLLPIEKLALSIK
jgi:hypothetical protein